MGRWEPPGSFVMGVLRINMCQYAYIDAAKIGENEYNDKARNNGV